MRERRIPKHPEAEARLGTLRGFYEDLLVACTYHGVRALMKKHFPVVSENPESLIVKVDLMSQIYFSVKEWPSKETIQCRNGSRNHLLDTRWECYFDKDGKKTLIWYQEKHGSDFTKPPVILMYQFAC